VVGIEQLKSSFCEEFGQRRRTAPSAGPILGLWDVRETARLTRGGYS